MDYIINGGQRIAGEIPAYGAKNCVLPLLGACMLTDDEIILHNCPKITDVENMTRLLRSMGKQLSWNGDTITVEGRLSSTQAQHSLAKLLRGSALILGSTLAKYGEIDLPLPGGCAIGKRPMDIHLAGLERMGAQIECIDNVLICRGALHCAEYEMRFPSVGATENLLCAAALTNGETILKNCATEPEVEALERMLVSMGCCIEGVGTPNLAVRGVEKLRGTEFTVIPDRIVVATYLSAAIASCGKVTVTNCQPRHLRAFLNMLQSRVDVTEYSDAVTIDCNSQPTGYGRVTTAPYPFFPTDMQSLVLALASFSNGGSTVICENLFESRLEHIARELALMGGNILVENNVARVVGSRLSAAEVTARDLRGGAALVIAGLNAIGQTTVHGVENICRGYLDFAENLSRLGAKIIIKD